MVLNYELTPDFPPPKKNKILQNVKAFIFNLESGTTY